MFFSVLLILLLSVCCSAFVSFFRPVDPFLVLSRLFMLYTLCFFSAVDVGVCLYVISFYVLCVCFLFVVLQFPLLVLLSLLMTILLKFLLAALVPFVIILFSFCVRRTASHSIIY